MILDINLIFFQFLIDLEKLNFILRILFTIKIFSKNLNKESIFISRSIIFALFASVLKKCNIRTTSRNYRIIKIYLFFFKKLKINSKLKIYFFT